MFKKIRQLCVAVHKMAATPTGLKKVRMSGKRNMMHAHCQEYGSTVINTINTNKFSYDG